MRTLGPAAAYFGLVFGVGFLLGILRVAWLLPRLGERVAELAEMPLMLVIIVRAAQHDLDFAGGAWPRFLFDHVMNSAFGCALALMLLLFVAGCASTAAGGGARFACYDARGRFAATVITQGECELRNWQWRRIDD